MCSLCSANGAVTTLYAPAYLVPPGPRLTLLSTTNRLAQFLDITEVNGQLVLATNHAQLVTSVLAWPAGMTNYFLQSTDGLSQTNFWRSAFGESIVIGQNLVVTNSAVNGQRFYRLHRF